MPLSSTLRTRRARAVLAGAAALAAATSVGLAGSPASAATSGSSGGQLVYQAHPPLAKAAVTRADLPTGPADCLAQTGGAVACQTPQSIRSAYDIPATIDGQPAGTGQTVVIVDAYGSPTARQDLQTFSDSFGLPSPKLDVVYPGGKPTWQGTDNQVGWAEETSLDLQWAHAVAPGATIDLVVAANNRGDVLNNAVSYAVSHHLGNVLSMSYGAAEGAYRGNNGQVIQQAKAFRQGHAAGISMFASSGDDGSDNNLGSENFSYPASDPNVVAVGGTNLYTGSGSSQSGETVWGDYADCPFTCAFGPVGATGGAPSLVTDKPGSDVSYDASVYTGVLTYLGFLGGPDNGFYYFGGTSAGSPQWAGITADVDQAVGHSVGDIRPDLQRLAATGVLRDVTQGSNTTPTFSGGYSAAPGYDAPTGWGTPDVQKLITAYGG